MTSKQIKEIKIGDITITYEEYTKEQISEAVDKIISDIRRGRIK